MIREGTAPEGVTPRGLKLALEHRAALGDLVKSITEDAIKETHKNGMAKEWGQSVLELLRLGLLLEYKDDNQKETLQTWKARGGGKTMHKQQSLLLYVESPENLNKIK